MPSIRGSFGSDLLHFARAIDIVDQSTWANLERLVVDYVSNQFGMTYFAFMVEDVFNDQQGLRAEWTTADRKDKKTVFIGDGEYNGHTAMAFAKATPLWIVRKNEGVFAADVDPAEYEDLWSSIGGLPRYVSTIENVRTSIIVPVERSSHVMGVLDFEDERYLKFNRVAEQELENLAAAIALLYDLRVMHETQHRQTELEITELKRDILSRRSPTGLSRPAVFFAYAERSDAKVCQTVRDTLEEFKDYIRLTDWDRPQQGNIPNQTLSDIVESRFGICYLSEPTGDGSLKFRDSPNVIFEAGMLHALTNANAGGEYQWLPIREREDLAGKTPFDFEQEWTIEVPRTKPRSDGQLPNLKREELKDKLRGWMHHVLGIPEA